MELGIRHEFLYGGLCHLGLDGYREFIEMRRKIRERRIKMIQEQQARRRDFVEAMFTGFLIVAVLAVGGLVLFMMIDMILSHA